MPRLPSAKTVAWGWVNWGRRVWMTGVHAGTRGWQDLGILLRRMGASQPPIPCPLERCLVISVLRSYRHFSKTYPRKGAGRPCAWAADAEAAIAAQEGRHAGK